MYIQYIQGLFQSRLGTADHALVSEVEDEVNLRPTVSRPVCPGVRRPSGTCDQFFFRHEISFRQLRLWYFVAPCLTRRRVYNLLLNCFWALPEQSLLSRSPAELTAIVYCLIWDSPNLEDQVPVCISPRNRVAQLYPPALGCNSLSKSKSKSKSHYDRQSVGQTVMVSGAHLGPATNFSFSSRFFFRQLLFGIS
jgi:hypothetical protein